MPDPSGPSRLIEKYELLSALAGQMREAANLGEWEKLTLIEQQCTEVVSDIKSLDASLELDETTHQRKTQLIHKILADHAEVDKYTRLWMNELQGNLETIAKSNRQEQRLQDTYGI
ncbi:MAG: flagellar protein FliT [Sulfuricella denitrificans]|nr:flagellar protein FliT [Sulfuricella denitrificans]